MDILGLPGEVVGIVLGWALGVLSPILAWEAIRQREKDELLTALKGELTELRVTLAMEAHGLQEKVAALDDSFLAWEIATLRETPGVAAEVQTYIKGLESLLPKSLADRSQPSSTALLRKGHRLMLLEANLGKLGMYPIAFQQRILNVLSQLSFWNDDVRFLEEQFGKTFDSSLSLANHTAVRANIDRNYRKALRAARSLCDDIGTVLKA